MVTTSTVHSDPLPTVILNRETTNMKRGTSSASKKATSGSEITTEKLVEQGNNAVATMQPELALKFFQRAHDMNPDDTNIIDALADVHLQLGSPEKALDLLLISTSLAPEVNPFKWLYLAQLYQGMEAVNTYLKAIEIMERASKSCTGANELRVFRRQTAKACCGVAELFLTDLCFDDDAEAKCEEFVTRALSVDPNSLDGQQVLANLRISQCRGVEAAEVIERVYRGVKSIREKIAARTVIEEMMSTELPEEATDIPEPEFCIATAKYMVECASVAPNLAELAMDLVTDLLHDDDENIELWYIMGVAALSCRPPDIGTARYHLEQAKDMMETLRENMAKQVGGMFVCLYFGCFFF